MANLKGKNMNCLRYFFINNRNIVKLCEKMSVLNIAKIRAKMIIKFLPVPLKQFQNKESLSFCAFLNNLLHYFLNSRQLSFIFENIFAQSIFFLFWNCKRSQKIVWYPDYHWISQPFWLVNIRWQNNVLYLTFLLLMAGWINTRPLLSMMNK